MSEFAGQRPIVRGAAHHERGHGPRLRRAVIAAGVAALVLAGCQVSDLSSGAHLAPIPAALERKIERLDMAVRSPILLRLYKEENVLEVWKEDRSGRFRLLEEYEICAWSGELGPKIKEGDRQAPEGFYTVTPGQMNPNSSYHLAFNLGFPNTFDRAHGRTGSHLMVHGDCSSRGCYAMEDAQIQEIYALAREAFAGGQRAFQVQAFPFRMTPKNMARHRDSEHFAFWEMLKEGSDHFEVTGQPPKINVCERRYIFNATADSGSFVPTEACPPYTVRPDIERLVAEKRAKDMKERAEEILRLERREERDESWEEREASIAAFFNQSRSRVDDELAAASGSVIGSPSPSGPPARGVSDPGPPIVVAGIPVPRRSPLAGERTAADESGGFSLPNPFRRRDEPVSSTAGVTEAPAPAPAEAIPVASTAGVTTSADRQPAPPPAATALAPAQEEERGFFGRVASGTRGLFQSAGSLFD